MAWGFWICPLAYAVIGVSVNELLLQGGKRSESDYFIHILSDMKDEDSGMAINVHWKLSIADFIYQYYHRTSSSQQTWA